MKITTFTCLALLILTGTVLVSRAESYRTDINPALLYYQAFILAPNLLGADLDYLQTNNWQGQKLPERFGTAVSDYEAELKLLRQAAQQKVSCDWAIDMSRGPDTPLPHLAAAKRAAIGARYHAMWDLQNGKEAEARDDLLAAFVLARNVSRDEPMIGALVQYADEAIVCDTVAANFGQFSPETLKQFVDGLDAAPALGTMAAAIMMTDKLSGPDWLANKIQKLQKENPSNDAKVLEAVQGFEYSYGNKDTNVWQRILIASGRTSDGLLKLVRDMEPLYPRLARIMTLPLPEYEDRIQKFDTEIQKSQNPLVPVFFPFPVQSPRPREFRIQALEAMVHAAVEYKLHGESGLKSVMDPLGKGPFAFQRFVFEGVDRGFELKSAYTGTGYPCALIFVEKKGTSFRIDGPHIGEAIQP